MIILQLDSDQLKTLVQEAVKQVIDKTPTQVDTILAPTKDLLTITEAADFLNLAKPTIYGLVSKSKIPCMKRGKKLYFSQQELINWLQQGKRKTLAEMQEEAESYLLAKKKRG